MQLEYRILWFEDQPANVRPFEDNIRSGLARLGFEPKVAMRTVVAGGLDPMADLPTQRDVDLVLMDWKLGGEHDGATLARQIRQVFIDTDIVFYSSEAPKTLRKLIFDQDIDGVYCCHRTSLSDRTLGLIRAQMRKVLDLNHMRGIVMAATSDLDHAMIECLDVVHKVAYPGDGGTFAAMISTQVAAGLRRKAEEIEGLGRRGKLEKLLKDPNFGSAMRLAALQAELQKFAERITEAHLLEKLGAYLTEVITPRNDFAHRRAVVVGDQLRLEGREEFFNQESMIALRLRLLNHSENLRALLSLLREMAAAAGEQGLASQVAAVQRVVDQVEEAAKSD
jgi:CheY-like chemotaxis protein